MQISKAAKLHEPALPSRQRKAPQHRHIGFHFLSYFHHYMKELKPQWQGHIARLNFLYKQEINLLYVYETFPTCALKYIIELGDIIEYPSKISKEGYGNLDFNNGLKKSKFAYEIKHVDILENPIDLSQLKDVYNFVLSQSYAYDEKYPKLTKIGLI